MNDSLPPIRTYRPDDLDALTDLWREAGLLRPWNDPARDVARCMESPASTLFVCDVPVRDGPTDHRAPLGGSVMVGFEGHRGWVYYLAVSNAMRGAGLGRALMQHAEAWLARHGAPKTMLMIRAENTAVRGFYESLGYTAEPRTVMSRWLDTPPVRPDEAAGTQKLAVHVTRLEMRRPPPGQVRQPPAGGLRIERAVRPSIGFYRYLYREVGEPWLWWVRRAMPDDELAGILSHGDVSVNVLHVHGVPAGYAELDARRNRTVEIAYFGLMPQYIGRGYGPWLLDWAIRKAWTFEPRKVWLHTCNLDHPGALGVYQRAGFEISSAEDHLIDDPRAPGAMPPGMEFSSAR